MLRLYVDEEEVDAALGAAAGEGHVDVLRALWPWSEDVVFIQSAAYAAVENGQLQALQYLSERRGLAVYDSFDLYRAAELGHTAIVEFLADMADKADIDEVLCAAVCAGQTQVVRLILERYHPDKHALANAIPNAAKDCKMLTLPLDYCPVLEGSSKPVGREEGVSQGHKRAYCPLREAFDFAFIVAAKHGCVDVVKLLSERVGWPAAIGDMLYVAVINNQLLVTEMVLELCPKRESLKYDMVDILRQVASDGSIDMLKLLADKCGDAAVSRGVNIAVEKNNAKMVEVFVKKSSLEYRVNVLVKAAKEKRRDIVEVLLAHSDQVTYQRALPQIAADEISDVAELVISSCDHSTIVNVFADAAADGSVVLVRHLLGRMDAYIITRALICAAARGHIKVVEVLLEKSNVPAVNVALSAAAMEGRVEVVELLRDQCDQVIIDEAGARAKTTGYFEVVQLLENKKARRH